MVFKHYVANILNVFSYIDVKDPFTHIVLILIVSLYVFGYAWSFRFSHKLSESPQGKIAANIEPALIITVLVIINLVYLLFTIVQFSYLYGGLSSTLPEGFTYAEYARKGFFELMVVAVINFLILLISVKLLKRDGKRPIVAVNSFLSLLVTFTFNMLFSSNYKLLLYQEAYSFTELRIYVHAFLAFLGILFIIALLKIRNEGIPLFKLSFVCALVIYILLNYINVDKLISRNNIERYYRTGKVDMYYLQSLSYDAIPEIVKLADDENKVIAREAREDLKAKYSVLNRNFKWMEYNYSRNKAKFLLQKYFTE